MMLKVSSETVSSGSQPLAPPLSNPTDQRVQEITAPILGLESSELPSPPKLNGNRINEMNVGKLFSLYQAFFASAIQKHPIDEFAHWMPADFYSPESCRYPCQDLDIRLTIKEMKKVLRETDILQLREVSEDCKTLIVGCGNRPLSDGACQPILSGDDRGKEYQIIHEHPNAITINPHLAANPTLVAFFGTQAVPMLKDGQFDLIVMEGTQVGDSTIGRDELQRLLSDKGVVVSTRGDKQGYEFSWEDNTRNAWQADYQLPPVVIEDLNVYESFNYTS